MKRDKKIAMAIIVLSWVTWFGYIIFNCIGEDVLTRWFVFGLTTSAFMSILAVGILIVNRYT